jgi:broad specificity phosphatase PhoE
MVDDLVHFITHPEVVIDPAVAVTDWPLSSEGLRRMRLALHQRWVRNVRSVFCSDERKARDAAHILSHHLGITPIIIAALRENDRSTTGYLPKPEFEAVADAFFAQPEQSVRGWERAADAQQRIIGAVHHAVASTEADGDIAIVAHGGVGALLLCHLKQVAISRTEDQPGAGGGNVFVFERASYRLRSGWRPIDA